MVFIEIEGQPTYCASLHTLRMAVALAARLLQEVDERPSNIIPACAFCEKRAH